MSLPILYIKQGCPWCVDALEYFKQINLKLEVVDVIQNPSKMKDLMECSGQNKTPTLNNNGFVVKDFDLEEFKQAMLENPAEATKLGL
jgi:glutaredoxin